MTHQCNNKRDGEGGVSQGCLKSGMREDREELGKAKMGRRRWGRATQVKDEK